MPIFKILTPAKSNEHVLSGPVTSGWETWSSLQSALNELGPLEWELAMPLSGGIQGCPNGPIAMILVNPAIGMEDEHSRQTEKLEDLIASWSSKIEGAFDEEVVEKIKHLRERLAIVEGLQEQYESVN